MCLWGAQHPQHFLGVPLTQPSFLKQEQSPGNATGRKQGEIIVEIVLDTHHPRKALRLEAFPKDRAWWEQ